MGVLGTILIVIGFFVYFVVIPIVGKDFKDGEEPIVIRENQNIGTVISQRENLYSLVNEHLFKIRYINHPQMYGNELICTGGIDPAGNPLLTRIYVYEFDDEMNDKIVAARKSG